MTSRVLLALATLLLLLPMGAATSGDAGSGGDAPDDHEDALPIPLGVHRGTLGWEDPVDHYRFDGLAPGTGLRIVATPLVGDLHLYALRDDGSILAGTPATTGAPIEMRAVAYGGSALLSVHAYAEEVVYEIAVSIMPRHDLAIAAVELTPLDPAGLQREVRVLVVNEGAGHNPVIDTILRVDAVHADGSVRPIAHDDLWQVAPGEARTFAYRWDTWGEVGDVRLIATIEHPEDADPADNVAELRTHVLREGDGLDALHQRREARAGEAEPTLAWGVRAGPEGVTAAARADVASPWVVSFAWAGVRVCLPPDLCIPVVAGGESARLPALDPLWRAG